MANKKINLKPFKDRTNDLKGEFEGYWEPQMVEINQYLFPLRGRFLSQETKANDGKKRFNDILDGHGMLALRTLAQGIHTGLTSPNLDWLRLTFDDPELAKFRPVKTWLDDVVSLMYKIFRKSNFYQSAYNYYEESSAYGTAAMHIEPDFKNIIRCKTFTAGEWYADKNHRGEYDTLVRIFYMRIRNLVKWFGEENIPPEIMAKSKNQKLEYVKVVNVVMPNDDMDMTKIDNRNMPFSSVYYIHGCQEVDKPLNISGFKEFPFAISPWASVASEVYGIGPGMVALGDVKQLQESQGITLDALNKVVDPPLRADDNMKSENINQIPGGVTYQSGMAGSQPVEPVYQISPNFQMMELVKDQLKNIINRHFYNDLLFLLSDPNEFRTMTATEAVIRKEKQVFISPVIESLQTNFLEKDVDLTFDIMSEMGILPPIPPDITGRELKVNIISPLAQAQQRMGSVGIERLSNYVATLAGIKPEAVDKLDFDKSIDKYGEFEGVPTIIIKSDEEAQIERDARAQAAQMQQTGENMIAASGAAKDLAGSDMEGDNALTRMMGGGGG
jgi:hypothetical protein